MYEIQTFASSEESKSKGILGKAIGILITLFLIIMIFVILETASFFKIKGSSMNPTLYEGEFVVCLKTDVIRRGDMVAFLKNNEYVIKRVVGLPGETINIEEDGKVIINEIPLNEYYLDEKAKGDIEVEMPYRIAENSYFLLGDNRDDSLDSRHHQIGTLTQDEIICKVEFVL